MKGIKLASIQNRERSIHRSRFLKNRERAFDDRRPMQHRERRADGKDRSCSKKIRGKHAERRGLQAKDISLRFPGTGT